MKYFSFSILVTLLFTSISLAQETTATIIDEKQQPIPYATIQIGSGYGLLSNAEGVFTINTEQFKPDAMVTISYMGFETLEIPINELKATNYTLKSAVTELDEVFVTNKVLSPEEIIQKALENAPSNYQQDNYQQTFFVRSQENSKLIDFEFEIDKATQLTKSERKQLNQDIEKLSNASKNKTSTGFAEYYGKFYHLSDSAKTTIDRAVLLKDKDRDLSTEILVQKIINLSRKFLEPGATYKVRSGILPITDSLKTNEDFNQEIDTVKGKNNYMNSFVKARNQFSTDFYKNEDLNFLSETKRYEYQLDGYTTINNETVYVISFIPDSRKAKYHGKLYINAYDYAIVRAEYTMEEDETAEKVNLKFLLGIKYISDRVNVVAVFEKNSKGKYGVKFLREEGGNYVYFSRSFKFIENRESRKEDKKKFKFDFTFELDVFSTDEFYVLEEDELTTDTFAEIKNQKKYTPIEIESYDPNIWKGYNVISPIEEIKNYRKE